MASLLTMLIFWVLIMAVLNNYRRWRFAIEVWKGFRPMRLLRVTGLISLILAVAAGIGWAFPLLSNGWASLIGHQGNIILIPLTSGIESGGEQAARSFESLGVLKPPPTLISGGILLLLAIPFIAEYEEIAFRKGREQWPKLIGQALIFGPLHIIAGIPMAAGIALILPGLWYGYRYRLAVMAPGGDVDSAILEATREHAALNTVVVVYLLAVIGYASCGYCAANEWIFFK